MRPAIDMIGSCETITKVRPMSDMRSRPTAVATVKRLVLSAATADDAAVLDDAAESLVGLLRRPEAQEGMRAFKAKQPPSWAKE